MDQENRLQSPKLSLFLVVVFVLSAGIVTGLNISRQIPLKKESVIPAAEHLSQNSVSVLSVSTLGEATSSSQPQTHTLLPHLK
jgi:hypothetical protein